MFFNECYDSEVNSRYYTGALFSSYGTAKAYMCAWTPNICRPAEWAAAIDWMRNTCSGLSSNGFMETGKSFMMVLYLQISPGKRVVGARADVYVYYAAFLQIPAWNKVLGMLYTPSYQNYRS